jgi:hypothetical protein
MEQNLKLSYHARQRMNQRRISFTELSLVLHYGRQVYRAGVKFIFLGQRDLPVRLARQYDHLIGTTVLISEQDVITVYKNRNALADIKRKWKRNTRKRC